MSLPLVSALPVAAVEDDVESVALDGAVVPAVKSVADAVAASHSSAYIVAL